MPRKTNIAWGKICFWMAVALLLSVITWENVQRLQNNIYANYEKAVDYGRVREEKTQINPVMAAIFYAGKNTHQKNVSTYFDHSANYRRENVKMVAVPKLLNKDSVAMVEKLYSEIAKHNQIDNIALVYDKESHADKHRALLETVMHPQAVSLYVLSAEDTSDEKQIEPYFEQDGGLVVVLTDLSLKTPDFLGEEAVYWAQKYHYNMNVFDVIDTQLAQAVDKDYITLFSLQNTQEQPLLEKQKHNLEQYERRYGMLLWHWFMVNMTRAEQNLPPMWPLKSDDTYRLYDRGTIYAKTDTFEKVVDNSGIVVALVRMAQRFVHKNIEEAGAKLYLLTDKEDILPQVADLDIDDGVYLTYDSYKALVLPNERAPTWAQTVAILRQKAGIPSAADEAEFKYYKFKAVEINNEN